MGGGGIGGSRAVLAVRPGFGAGFSSLCPRTNPKFPQGHTRPRDPSDVIFKIRGPAIVEPGSRSGSFQPKNQMEKVAGEAPTLSRGFLGREGVVSTPNIDAFRSRIKQYTRSQGPLGSWPWGVEPKLIPRSHVTAQTGFDPPCRDHPRVLRQYSISWWIRRCGGLAVGARAV